VVAAVLAGPPVLWGGAAAVAVAVAHVSAGRYADAVDRLAERARVGAEALDDLDDVKPLPTSCLEAERGRLVLYWGGVAPEIASTLEHPHPSGLVNARIFGWSGGERSDLTTAQVPARVGGSTFNRWTTFLTELPGTWPRWADPTQSSPRVDDVEYLAVARVVRLDLPQVAQAGVVVVDAPARVAVGVLDPETGERRCAGVLEALPPEVVRITATGRGLDETRAREDAERRLADPGSQLQRYWTAYLGRMEAAALLAVCDLDAEPRTCSRAEIRAKQPF
jgi:hypothetical protein